MFSRFRPEEIYSRDGVTLGHLNERGHRVAADQMFKWLGETRRF
jgi:hypothetical protein